MLIALCHKHTLAHETDELMSDDVRFVIDIMVHQDMGDGTKIRGYKGRFLQEDVNQRALHRDQVTS
jgi:hypothetical protein